MRIATQLLAIVSMLVITVGCSSSTRINFDAPPGTVLMVEGKPHHLPGSIEFKHPSETGKSKRYSLSLVTTLQQQELRPSGYIDVFGFSESDLDKKLNSTCNLDAQHLAQLNQNMKIVFQGQTASRQHLYDLTLTKP